MYSRLLEIRTRTGLDGKYERTDLYNSSAHNWSIEDNTYEQGQNNRYNFRGLHHERSNQCHMGYS